MELLYKTLFEVNLLSEYFLLREDGSSFFDLVNSTDRQQRLQQAFDADRESIARDIHFAFPASMQETYNNYGLKLLPSYTGCRVLIRVKRQVLANQTTVFLPYFGLPCGLDIFITLEKKNSLPNVYMNAGVSNTVPAIFLFSNENIPDAKTSAFIVNKPPVYAVNQFYEQGALVLDSGNLLQEIYYDTNGARQFKKVVPAIQDFAGTNDCVLVPWSFNYLLPGKAQVNQLTCTLKDQSNTVLKTISVNQAIPIRSCLLDFTELSQKIQLSGNLSLPAALCILEVKGNGGYSETRRLVFDNQLYATGNWGLLHIRPTVSNAGLNLLAADGFLVKRQNAAGVWTDPRVFEIPVKSRLGHFRYLNNRQKKLDLLPALNNFLVQENGALTTLMPKSLSHYFFLVEDNANSSTKYLPNPVCYEPKKDDKQRIVFDVIVPESDLFPIIP